jgi:two-component system sensor histidine kinase BarA
MPRLRLSLASKCQLMFGLAVLLILIAALAWPWLRMGSLVEEGQRQTARQLADAWLAAGQGSLYSHDPARTIRIRRIGFDQVALRADGGDPFVAEAMRRFTTDTERTELFQAEQDEQKQWIYRYARAVLQSDLDRAESGLGTQLPGLPSTQVANPLRQILLIEIRAAWASDQIRLNQLYLATAGICAGILAIAVFWFITTRIVLSPVRVLRETAEKVAEGDLNIRSDINTGDEFEQLSNTFNTMLTNLKSHQDQLEDLNRQLDLKLGELSASNVTLDEANRLKGDFLASVSHELRTPLNSILGFAEVLVDTFEGEDEATVKRRRYVQNIIDASRTLLNLITELLDLAKIEAGRIELYLDDMPSAEVCTSLLNLMRPQADRKSISLQLHLARDLPIVRTDPGKFQQIIFNMLSNAIKFTPAGGQVELIAEIVPASAEYPVSLSVSVRDTGPGIPVEKQSEIFEKFRQLDDAHTREHGGAGLGLAISSELATMLTGRIDLVSQLGAGATFSLIIPVAFEESTEALMPEGPG